MNGTLKKCINVQNEKCMKYHRSNTGTQMGWQIAYHKNSRNKQKIQIPMEATLL